MFVFRAFLRTVVSAVLLTAPLFAQTFSVKNYPPFTDSFQFAVGDFNKDGAADLLGDANYNGSEQVYIYMNNGSGVFGTPKAIAGTTGALQVAVGDFNQDGKLDFAFAGPSAIEICYGDGTGNFSAPVAVSSGTGSFAVGDFNLDGKPDIAFISGTSTVTVLLNTGSTFTSYSFSVPLYYSSNNKGYAPDIIYNLVAGDFDGTHHFDLAYIDSCNDSACGPGLARIYVLTNNNNNSFTPNLLADQISGTGQMTTADVDLDGKLDMVVRSVAGNYGDELFVEYSNGGGNFTKVDAEDSAPNLGMPETVVVGDFNNDDIEDLATLTDQTLALNPDMGFDVYLGKGGRNGFSGPTHVADNTTVSPRGGFASAFLDKNGTRDVTLDDANGLSVFLNTTSTTGDPCAYVSGSGLHTCLPANNGSGTSPVHFLATYKAAIQPAQRIEVWADGKKAFQDYGDLLNTSLTLSPGTHQLVFVGVDATGNYVKSSPITYAVTGTACAPPPQPGVLICAPANGSTVSSPVTVSAADSPQSGLKITATRLYVDNTAVYTTSTNTLNTSVTMATGSHKLVVVGYESNGSALTATSTITVK